MHWAVDAVHLIVLGSEFPKLVSKYIFTIFRIYAC